MVLVLLTNPPLSTTKCCGLHVVSCSEDIKIRQAQVDKLYAGLKDLAEERRGKLDETLKLHQLNREIDDLELWIADKEVVAGSQDIGQDLAQVEVSCAILFLNAHFCLVRCGNEGFGKILGLAHAWLRYTDKDLVWKYHIRHFPKPFASAIGQMMWAWEQINKKN